MCRAHNKNSTMSMKPTSKGRPTDRVSCNRQRLLPLIGLLAGMTACQEPGETLPPAATNDSNGSLQSATLKLLAVDELGRPLGGVQVVSDGLQIITRESPDEPPIELKLKITEAGGLLRLQRPGYLDALLFVNRFDGDAEYRLVLTPAKTATATTHLAAR